MKAVFHHELSMYYHSMRTYVFAAFLLMFTGVGSLIYNINASVANFEYALAYCSIIFVVLVPLLTMHIVSEERRQKTDQLLYSLPISTANIVLGKFFSVAVVFAVPMLFISTYPLIFAKFRDVYLPTSYGTIFAFFLLGLALISIGMFISCLTESQGMAAGICVAVMLFCYYCDTLANYMSSGAAGSAIGIAIFIIVAAFLVRLLTKSDFAGIITGVVLLGAFFAAVLINAELLEGLLPAVMEKISLFSRFENFVNGIFDVTAVVYYISVTGLFLFLCVQALEKRRYNG